jgi:predicted RNA-binding Zn-ribbon protein involved in translation (DUF1610 family)
VIAGGDGEAVTKETAMTHEIEISASCPDCGEVELAAEQLWLVLTPATGNAYYNFRCPDCGENVRHEADEATVELLARWVPVEELSVPAEALESHDGPALTLDDLIDLMLSLDGCAASAQPAGVAA